MPCAKVWKLAFHNLLKIVWPSACLLSSPRKRMQSWMRMQGMSCEKWSVPCTIQRTSETCCNSLHLRFPLCPQWNHVRTKNEILSTRSTVASITAFAYSFAWCPVLPALYGFMLWTKCPRNIHERSIGFCGYTDGVLSILHIDWKHVMSPVSTGICLLLCLCFATAVTWTACKSSMEWCWDGEKCLQFHQWNGVAIAHFASENCDLSENLKCAMYAMCKSVKVGFPQPVEDRLTFSFSCFFTSQADAILTAHAGNVLRKMKCPLHYAKNIRNLLQLTATPISPMPAMKPRSHQKWNTLNSQHGGLDHGLCIFFCLVSSVAGPLWVHVVDKMPKKHPYIENTSCRHYTSYQEIDGSTTFIVPSLQALKSALKQTGHVITGHQMSTNTCQRNPHSPN